MNIKDIVGSATFNVQTMNVFVVSDDDSKEKIVNPGVEYDTDGKAKWSPPLQQQMDTMKDVVGTTTDDPTVEPSDEEKHEIAQDSDASLERIKKLAAVLAPSTQFPAR